MTWARRIARNTYNDHCSRGTTVEEALEQAIRAGIEEAARLCSERAKAHARVVEDKHHALIDRALASERMHIALLDASSIHLLLTESDGTESKEDEPGQHTRGRE